MKFRPTDELRKYRKKYPNMPKLRLAKLIFKQQPTLYQNVESIRRSLGKLNSIPTAKKTSMKDTPVKIVDPGFYGIISDLHIPYHNEQAVETALKDFETRKVKGIILLGDITDFHSVSRWENDPRNRDLAGELDMLVQFLEHLRERFPRAKIYYKIGNHEERLFRYMISHAPELLDMECLQFDNLIQAERLKIEVVNGKQLIHVGKLVALHGHEYRFSISNPVNPARGLFLRSNTTGICGHFHRTSEHTSRTLKGNVVSCWSIGCLCQLNPDYSPFNQWNLGYALVKVHPNQDFQVYNKTLTNEGEGYG
jgi:UDP-2,3-diacylglucosamine pyrophosphatase LpxH